MSKNPEEARRKIIEAAIAAFGETGFRGTSTELIAERAGYSQATVFFHFGTKPSLLQACLEECVRRALATIRATGASGTVELVSRLDGIFDDRPTAEFLSVMLLEQSRNEAMRPIYASFHGLVRQEICDEIVREVAVSPGAASEAAAKILSMMIGVHAEFRVEKQLFSRADYARMLTQVTQLIIDDLRRTPR
ncbi:TetR/AcrR family transcriptional regulator [Caulobacter mirabilis]|uniref:TetR/AcrR family transcriptional regulator n=1 Tax=Caulobacter mirabilis TaxID=69666 RepID=UPI001559BCF7|nr:TetR/AcrR family transcriptional regulator [Caulobacter mirabilis]